MKSSKLLPRRVRADRFEKIEYPFKYFNPLQSEVFRTTRGKDTNVIISAPTASGKTVCGEILAEDALHSETDKVIYLSPLKALTEEKYNSWTDPKHSWSGSAISIMTGDYKLTEKKGEELLRARVILTTYEMLAVRARRASQEKSQWIDDASILIVDESHFLGSESRGNHLECSLVDFTRRNPEARIVFLSATMDNTAELADWLLLLNGKETQVVVSDYRPVKLEVHFETFQAARGNAFGTYHRNEELKYDQTIELLRQYPDDQWLVFVHTKAAGREVLRRLHLGVTPDVAFHSADLDRTQREKVEKAFVEGRIRYLVATSTLAYGLNLPARRVCVVGTTRGMNEVDPSDVVQEFGRAGRPSFDTVGDAYLVLPETDERYWQWLLKEGVKVHSVLKDSLGFHLIGEIAEERVMTPEAAEGWYGRTLSCLQVQDSPNFEEVFELYENNGLIVKNRTSFVNNGTLEYVATSLGHIASLHYFEPLWVSAWADNFAVLKRRGLTDDAAFAWAYTSVSKEGFIGKELRGHVTEYLQAIGKQSLVSKTKQATADGVMLYNLLLGREAMRKTAPSLFSSLIHDLDRVVACLRHIFQRVLKYSNDETTVYWDRMHMRIRLAIQESLYELCTLPGIGKVYAGFLASNGIGTISEVRGRMSEVKNILPSKTCRVLSEYLKENNA